MVTIDSAIPAEQLHSINSQTIPSSSGRLGAPPAWTPRAIVLQDPKRGEKEGNTLTILQEYYSNSLSVDKVVFFLSHTVQIVEKLKEIQPSNKRKTSQTYQPDIIPILMYIYINTF